jgi:hypothetical protein
MTGRRSPKKPPERIGRIPQGRHDSRGVANSWKSSTFVANTAGHCAVCGESFPIGTNVQMWRDTKKRVHPRCADGVARSTGNSKPGKSVEEQAGGDIAKLQSTNHGPTTKREGAREEITDPSTDDQLLVSAEDLRINIHLVIRSTSCPVCEVRTGTACKGLGTQSIHKCRVTAYGRGGAPKKTIDLSVDDRLFVSGKDLRITTHQIIDNTSCAVCGVETGTPCRGVPTRTMHKYRATTYGRSQGSSPYREIPKWVM